MISSAISPTFSRLEISEAEKLIAKTFSIATINLICARLSHPSTSSAVVEGSIIKEFHVLRG